MALRVWGASAVAVAVGLSTQATAQQSAVPAEEAAAPGYVALDPIAIFATLTPIAAFDYPGQVSVVAREEIQTRQASSIGEVLKDVPGVFVDGGARRSGQAPTIRGFREEDILILVDGAKQSFISGHDGRIFIEPDFLKSVEVVKGPVSALYGSGALGGVIALTTVDAADFLDPGETAGVRVKAGYQSVNDEYAITTTGFARSLDGRYVVVASFTYRDAGDIELGNGVTLPEDEQIKSSLLKGTAQLTPDLKLTTSWVHYETDAVNPNNPQGNNVGDIVDRIVESDTVSAKLSYNPLNPFIDGNLLVYWARHSNEETDTFLLRGATTPRASLREIETTGVNIDNRSRFKISDTTKLTLTYGAEYYVDRQTGEDTNASLTNPSNVPDADASYYGAFVQAEFDIKQPAGLPGELKIIPGVRWDGFENDYKDVLDYEDFKDQAVSPKIGASYKPVPWLLLFGNYGSAFRAPSYTELYAQGIHFPGGFGRFGPLGFNRFIDNPDLRPQEAETVEVGAGLDFDSILSSGDKFTVKGSYWQTDAKNFIDLSVVASGCAFAPPFVFDQDTCVSQFVNTPNAELDGVEIEANYEAARWFASLAYTHIDGRNTDTGEFLGTLQPDKIVLNAGVKVPEWWSRFGARFIFADEFTKFNPGDGPRDAYNLVDLYAVIEPEDGPFKGFRLDLGIDNVTDEAYELIAKNVFKEGRNYKAAITYTHKW